MRIRSTGQSRGGAAAVEMAFCIIPLFMLFFGIFEYGRYMMDRNLLDNAVRAGCRLAVAHNTDKYLLGPASSQGGSGVANVSPTTTVSDTISLLLANRQNSDFSSGPTVTITGVQASTGTAAAYLTNNAGSSGSQLGISSLGPGDSITVTVQGTFKFIFPSFIYVPSTVPMNSSVTMLCEGGN
jgi:Flp pilus assembly protein TadG